MVDKITAISNNNDNFERIKNDAETYETKIKFFKKSI